MNTAIKFNTSTVIMLGIIYVSLFLIGTETYIISPLLPDIATDLSTTIPVAAHAITSYVLVYAVSAPLLGFLADRLDRRHVLMAGLVLFAAGNALAARSSTVEILIVARALGGLGGALAGPSIWAAIVDAVPVEARGRAVGLGMAAFSLGQVAGVPIGAVLASAFGWRALFLALAGATVLVLAGAAPTWLGTRERAAAASPRRSAPGILLPWRIPESARILAATGIFHAGNLGAYAYLGAMLHTRFSFGVTMLGAVGVAVGIGSIAGAVLAGHLSDRARRAGSSEAGRLPLWCALLAAALVAVGVAPTSLSAVLIVGVWFVASGAYVTDSQAIITGVVADARALASAWTTTSMYAGTAIGVLTLGTSTDDLRLLYGAASAFPLTALFICLPWGGRFPAP